MLLNTRCSCWKGCGQQERTTVKEDLGSWFYYGEWENKYAANALSFFSTTVSSSERRKSLFKNLSELLLFSHTSYVNVMENYKSLFNKITKNMIIPLSLIKGKRNFKGRRFKGKKSNMLSIRKIEITSI